MWDVAASVQGESLNSHLLTGSDLAENLILILFNFREKRYALGGDIKKMFHQIRYRDQDQDVQRCLWREDDKRCVKISKMTVTTFGAATIAQFVKNYHANKYVAQRPRAVDAIVNRHYVDDYVDSFDTWQEGKKIADQVFQIHDEDFTFVVLCRMKLKCSRICHKLNQTRSLRLKLVLKAQRF